MLLADLLTSVAYTLQDTPHNRWKVDEIISYINDGLRDMATRTYAFEAKDTFNMDAITNAYQLSNMPVKLKSVSTTLTKTLTYEVINFDTLVFDAPEECVLTVKYYIVPATVTQSTVNIPLYHNMTDALRNFVLARCYAKDETTENFNKMAIYEQRYIATLSENMNGVDVEHKPALYQKDFY